MSLLTLLKSLSSSVPTAVGPRHMLLLALSSHVAVPSDQGAGTSQGSSTVVGVGASIASAAGLSAGAAVASSFTENFVSAVGTSTCSATVTGAGAMIGTLSSVGVSSGHASVSGNGIEVVENLPEDILVEMGLGGSYRNWLKDRGTCVRHWFLGDVATVQARDEITEDASGDGIYQGDPSIADGMVPEYGLSKHFDGVDDKVDITSGLTGIGGTFSLVSLVRPHADGMGTGRTIKRTGVSGAAILGINPSDRAIFGVYGGTKATAPTPLVAGQAYLIVGSYNGTTATIHVVDLETGDIDSGGPTALTFTAAHGVGLIGADA